MMHLYGYKVVYFNDYEEQMNTERGMIIASDFCDAMDKVIRMYGQSESEDIQIYFIEEGVTVITEENIRNIIEQWEAEDEHEALENNCKEEEDTAAH